jgi:hypothetical protein
MRPLCLLLLVAAAALPLAGCSDSVHEAAAAQNGGGAEPPVTTPVTNPVPTDAPDVETPDDPVDGPQVVVEPDVLDIGNVKTYERGYGTVNLVNRGNTPVTVVMCKSTCGCAAASCPKGKVIEPGGLVQVPIRVNSDSRPLRIEKEMTFGFEGAPPAKLLVKAETISVVNAEPWDLIPGTPVTLRSTDGAPFRVTGVSPEIVLDLPVDAQPAHLLMIDWGAWRAKGSARKIVFTTDHPECPQVLTMVEAPPPE